MATKSSKTIKSDNRPKSGVYKKEEFEAFLDAIETGAQAHWLDFARILGVSKDTITQWRKHPRAVAAVRKGIANSLTEMERVGKRDWRMHEAKLRMLGINPVNKQQLVDEDGAYSSVEAIIVGTGLRKELMGMSKKETKVDDDRQSDGDISEPSENQA